MSHKKTQNKLKTKVKINLPPPYVCKICNEKNIYYELKSTPGLSSHLINRHNICYEDYLMNYCNIDVKKINDDWEKGREERERERIRKFTTGTFQNKIKSPKERMSEEQYSNWRESMKKVYSLDWFINKYGEEQGNFLYDERSKKISKTTHFKKYNKENKENWSKISQELFWEIYNIIKNDYEKIYFGELNHEYGCETNTNFDFVIIDNKKVIEFNGDKYHANPKIYEKNDIPLKYIGKTSEEIWDNDKLKNQKLINNGYELKIIWESDYKKNKNDIILECIKYIKS